MRVGLLRIYQIQIWLEQRCLCTLQYTPDNIQNKSTRWTCCDKGGIIVETFRLLGVPVFAIEKEYVRVNQCHFSCRHFTTNFRESGLVANISSPNVGDFRLFGNTNGLNYHYSKELCRVRRWQRVKRSFLKTLTSRKTCNQILYSWSDSY